MDQALIQLIAIASIAPAALVVGFAILRLAKAKEAATAFRKVTRELPAAIGLAKRDYSRMDINEQIRIAQREVDEAVDARLAGLERRVDAVFGNAFYLKAMQAVLPGKKGRDEFAKLLGQKVTEVADLDSLGRDLDRIANAHTGAVLKPLEYLQSCFDAYDLRKHSAYLLSRSREVTDLLDADDPLRNVLSAQIKIKQFALGESLALAEVLSYALLQNAGVPRAIEASLKMGTKWLLPQAAANFAEVFLVEIRDAVVAEIGETALEELLSCLAIFVIPIAGQILALWPMIRYGRLWHRMFVQQRPLQPLKQKLRVERRRLIEDMRQEAKRTIVLQVNDVKGIVEKLDRLEESCVAVQDKVEALA